MAMIDLGAVDGPTCVGFDAAYEADEIGDVEAASVSPEEYVAWVLATLGGKAVSKTDESDTPIHLRSRLGGDVPTPPWSNDVVSV